MLLLGQFHGVRSSLGFSGWSEGSGIGDGGWQMEIKVWGWGGWKDVLGSALGYTGHGVKIGVLGQVLSL